MAQAPMMPVFVDALLGDTLDLTAEQFGAYLLLLFATWRNNGNPLPDDPRKLARICRCSVKRWTRVLRPALIGFFKPPDDGFLHQKRLEKEWQFCAKVKARNARNGVAGGRPKKSNKPLETQETIKPRRNPDHNPDVTQTISPLSLSQEGRRNLASKELNSLLPSPREATPPLPSQGDGGAASRPPDLGPPTKAEGTAAFKRCIDAVNGKLGVLDSGAAGPPPPDPRLVEFRARLSHLNTLAGSQLRGEVRMQAWQVIAEADSLADPRALPPATLADLDAIERLGPAEAAE
jgi:uncharacterized protein YdaU (DUF1376 family)